MQPERNTVVFYDDKKKLQTAQAAYPAAELRFVPGVPSAAELRACEGNTLVFMLANEKLQQATAHCRELKNTAVYVLPGGAGGKNAPVPADCAKPRLDYMETEITRVCNLNCRGCCDFSNLANDPNGKFYEFNRFLADLKQLKTLFWGVAKIRIMGGEPLLNPRLAEYAEAARSVFPDCDLRIVTNGLLLPGLSGETLARIRAADCSFDISNYPPTQKKKAEIRAVLQNAGIAYNFSVPMRFFFRNILEEPAEDPAPAFNNCIFTHCHMMGDGVLAPCSYAYCIHRFNARFGTAYPENDRFDLYAEGLNGWDIIKAFSAPHVFCKCCGSGIIPFFWQGGVHSAAAVPGDWQIRRSFINTTLAPKAQALVKNSAMALRARIQKKQ